MTTQERKIQCPNCGTSISIDEVLTRQIEESVKEKIVTAQKLKEQELSKKEKDLKKQADELATNKKELES